MVLSFGAPIIMGQTGSSLEQNREYKRIRILDSNCKMTDFPSSAYNPPPDRSFRSMFTGRVVNGLFPQSELNIFDNRLVIQIKMEYVLYGEKREATYYVLIYDFNKSVSDGMIVEPGDILGHVERSNPRTLVFSETLDPYLVINSNRPPVYYAGYFWFNPSFLSASGNARWMSFDPVDNIHSELAAMADHLTENVSGLALYDQRVRFKTKLSEYPREISNEERKSVSVYENLVYRRNGLLTHVTEINGGGYGFLLCWQHGFNEYLQKANALNKDIWLYGVMVTYDVWEKKGYVFLRDFTLESVEEIYEERLKELKGS